MITVKFGTLCDLVDDARQSWRTAQDNINEGNYAHYMAEFSGTMRAFGLVMGGGKYTPGYFSACELLKAMMKDDDMPSGTVVMNIGDMLGLTLVSEPKGV